MPLLGLYKTVYGRVLETWPGALAFQADAGSNGFLYDFSTLNSWRFCFYCPAVDLTVFAVSIIGSREIVTNEEYGFWHSHLLLSEDDTKVDVINRLVGYFQNRKTMVIEYEAAYSSIQESTNGASVVGVSVLAPIFDDGEKAPFYKFRLEDGSIKKVDTVTGRVF